MTTPAVFAWASANLAVQALLGTTPCRFWPFSSAPQPGGDGYSLPYAVFQSVYGTPANYIGHVPDADQMGVQVDAYARTASEARTVLEVLRDALEPHGYVVAFTGEERDVETGLYRCGLTAEFWTDR